MWTFGMMRNALNFLSLFAITLAERRPNIIIFLTDDQDLLLGGVMPVKQVQALIANQGVTFTNAFASTPICCPSRSSILTGLYLHNHQTVNNSLSGGCSSPDWQRDHEPNTFGATLHRAGYHTFYAGKYLNAYGYKEAGGTQHVPEGWDWWLGLVGNSRYYNYTLSVNGTPSYFTDQYLTTVIQNYSLEFLESTRNMDKSFLMVLAPPAPHTPYTPEPKYKGKYDGIKVPRTPNFNTHKLRNRHWLVNMAPAPLPEETIKMIDSYQARRWESLLSVDDLVAATVHRLEAIGQLNNTFLLFTSDHGYHLGQFALPWDKRQPYETDIRVPLFVRGPSIPVKTLLHMPVVHIDIAPTVLNMAGLPLASHVDGYSFLPYAQHKPYVPPRIYFPVEYRGEGDSNTVSPHCPLYNDNTLSECYPSSSCKCQDSQNNTYDCLRHLEPTQNTLYCEFYKEVGGHKEFYDLIRDPYQLDNKFLDLSSADQFKLSQDLQRLRTCTGFSCH